MRINRRDFLKHGALAAGALGLAALSPAACKRQSPKPATLWQLPGQTGAPMMGYMLKTSANEIIVIDGGYLLDAAFLFELVKKHYVTKEKKPRFHVHAWLLTHPHADHVGALTMLLNNGSGAEVDAVYASLPPQEWVERHADKWDRAAAQTNRNLLAAIDKIGHRVNELAPGQTLRFGGVEIEILSIRNPEITRNAVNNQSVVFRVNAPNRSVLFLGDLGVEGGRKLLTGPYRNRLRADCVQMAHHGQKGVGREVYEAVKPEICLWPTPGFLWDNDSGGGVNSGPWKTLEVRAWMDELGVKQHYVAKDGLCAITL